MSKLMLNQGMNNCLKEIVRYRIDNDKTNNKLRHQVSERGFSFQGAQEAKRNVMWLRNEFKEKNSFNESISSPQNNSSKIKTEKEQKFSDSFSYIMNPLNFQSPSNKIVQRSQRNSYKNGKNNLKQIQNTSLKKQTDRVDHFFQTNITSTLYTQSESDQSRIGSLKNSSENKYDNDESQKEGENQNDSNHLIKQIKLQEDKIEQLVSLLRSEIINSEQLRSKVSFLKEELLRSVSSSGLLDLFEEAYIASLDNKVEILIQLKQIQQKIEEEVSLSEMALKSESSQQFKSISENEEMKLQALEFQQMARQFQQKLEDETRKVRVISDELQSIQKINKSLQDQNSILTQENMQLNQEIKKIQQENQFQEMKTKNRDDCDEEEESIVKIEEMESLIRELNEERNELEKIIEEKDEVLGRIEEEYQEQKENNEELKNFIQLYANNLREKESLQVSLQAEGETQRKQIEEIAKKSEEIKRQNEILQKQNEKFKKDIEQITIKTNNQRQEKEDFHQKEIENLKQQLLLENRKVKQEQETIANIRRDFESNKYEKDNENYQISVERQELEKKQQEIDLSIKSKMRELEQERQQIEGLKFKLDQSAALLLKQQNELNAREQEINKKQLQIFQQQNFKEKDINKSDMQLQITRLQEENQMYIQSNTQLKLLVEQNYKILQQKKDQQFQERSIDKKNEISFDKQSFLISLLINIANNLSIDVNQQDTLSQYELESITLDINNKIDELKLELQQVNEQNSKEMSELKCILAEIIQEKYILEALAKQMKKFVVNEDVIDLVEKYTDVTQELSKIEQKKKTIEEAITQIQGEASERKDKEQAQLKNEDLSNKLEFELRQTISEYENLTEARDFYLSRIDEFQQLESQRDSLGINQQQLAESYSCNQQLLSEEYELNYESNLSEYQEDSQPVNESETNEGNENEREGYEINDD